MNDYEFKSKAIITDLNYIRDLNNKIIKVEIDFEVEKDMYFEKLKDFLPEEEVKMICKNEEPKKFLELYSNGNGFDLRLNQDYYNKWKLKNNIEGF